MLTEHRNSEELAAKATAHVAHGEISRAQELYSEAADWEKRALASIAPNQDRTRNVLSVSLVSLLYKAGRLAEAERTIFQLLGTGELKPWADHQLRELLEVVSDEWVLTKNYGRVYAGSAITMSLRGGEIGSGTGPFDLILEKTSGFRNLLYRFAEWVGDYPLRMRGTPPKDLTDLLQTRVAEPSMGSYRFEVRFTSPLQVDAFDAPIVQPEEVTGALFRFLHLLNHGEIGEFMEYVPDEGYRTALLQLTRNVAPSGKRIREIGIYRGSSSGTEIAYLTRATIQRVREVLPQREEESAPWASVEGVLRAIHLDENWLELTLPDGSTKKCITKPEMLDDVVGPMVNQEVVVRGPEKRWRGGVTKVFVEDIELVEA